MNEDRQFEIISALRGYAEKILSLTNGHDIRPSTAKMVLKIISRMHNIKDQLDIS